MRLFVLRCTLLVAARLRHQRVSACAAKEGAGGRPGGRADLCAGVADVEPEWGPLSPGCRNMARADVEISGGHEAMENTASHAALFNIDGIGVQPVLGDARRDATVLPRCLDVVHIVVIVGNR
jgi:hypothetical protein